MVKEFKSSPGVFAGHQIRRFENFRRPKTYIAQIPDGRTDNIENSHEISITFFTEAVTVMREFLQVFIFVITGVALLWFGYKIFSKGLEGIRRNKKTPPQKKGSGTPGDPRTCPICASKMSKGDLVQTLAYPSITGGKDRLMHIQGCVHCLAENIKRNCPVCGAALSPKDILIARMFERPHRRSHVHVLGCSRCKRRIG